jgi:hypothetical protein
MTQGEKRRGPLNGNAKLTSERVLQIRARYEPGRNQWNRGNASLLAKEFKLNKRSVLRLVSGEDWGWLD